MTIDQIIEAIRSGVTDDKLQDMLAQYHKDNPDERIFSGGELYQKVRTELSDEQLEQLSAADNRATLGSDFLDFMALNPGGTTASIAGKVAPKIGSALTRAFNFARGHKVATGAVGAAASLPFIGGVEEGRQGGEGPGLGSLGLDINTMPQKNFARGGGRANDPRYQDGNPTVQVPTDPGYNVMVIDHSGQLTGTPGAVAVITSAQMGLTPDPSLQGAIASAITTSGGTDAITFLSDYLSGNNPQAISQGRDVVQAIFPETLGQVAIDTPVQVNPSTSRVSAQSPISQLRPQAPPGTDPDFWERNVDSMPDFVENAPTQIPAGAALAPRIFNQFQGRTLLEWASISAQRHNVPLNLLYGVIDHESNWLTSAVGDNGNSFGLAQIYMPVWGGQVSRHQALNPVFALEWTAKMLRERFQQYGRWDAAVAAHNSPVAAQHLARTGRYYNEKSAKYTQDVLARATRSGLATAQFDDGSFTEVDNNGAQPGPTYTPFQTPDPAQSREYIRQVYEELLGRDPTEAELSKGVEKIVGLARSAYNANLRQLQGGESQAVDVEAQFKDEIRGTGEFEFHEERTEQRKFSDFASGIARLMQQGV